MGVGDVANRRIEADPCLTVSAIAPKREKVINLLLVGRLSHIELRSIVKLYVLFIDGLALSLIT